MTPVVGPAQHAIRLLELLARLDPRLAEISDLTQPVQAKAVLGLRSAVSAGEVSLNPQPLPPKETLWRGIRDVSVAVAEATIAASLAGRGPAEILKEVGDDLCSEPPKRPWPRKWPVPAHLLPLFDIDGNRIAPAVQATAALVFQTYAARTEDEGLSTAFAGLADRLAGAALKTDGHAA